MKPLTSRFILFLALIALPGCTRAAPPPSPAPGLEEQAARIFDAYMARPEPAYGWKLVTAPPAAETENEAAASMKVWELEVTSQTWQDRPWRHRVQIFRPARSKYADVALISLAYGGGQRDAVVSQMVANATGITLVQLHGIPNQPLYDRREDDLIAYTFQQFMGTADTSWPLLLPMTKSVVKTMDALDAFARQHWQQPLRRFIVGGASKRGWTSWLAAAADRRVQAIVPMVYDNLNLERQMPHQLESWGAYSEQIQDYTRLGLQQQLNTPRGKLLAAIVDPYTYRRRLTQPKLLIFGTNDRYWPLDALTLYRADLPGRTDVYYAPNAGHSLSGQEAGVFGTIGNWVTRWAENKTNPTVQLRVRRAADEFLCSVQADPPEEVRSAGLWVTRSATRDFRSARWNRIPAPAAALKGAFTTSVPASSSPDDKFIALIGEIELPGSMLPLRLSSTVFLSSLNPDAGR